MSVNVLFLLGRIVLGIWFKYNYSTGLEFMKYYLHSEVISYSCVDPGNVVNVNHACGT